MPLFTTQGEALEQEARHTLDHPDFPKSIVVFNLSARIRWANKKALETLGYPSSKDIEGKHLEEVFPPPYVNYDPTTNQFRDEFLKQGFTTVQIREIGTKDGSKHYVETIAYTICKPDGQPVGVFVEMKSFEDIIKIAVPMQEIAKQVRAFVKMLRAMTAPLQKELPASLGPLDYHICRYAADGKSAKQIADILNISHKTVQNHQTAIRKVLGVPQEQSLREYLKGYYFESGFDV